MNSVIIDYETLSTRPDAIILSVGLLCLDDEKEKTFESLLEKGEHHKFNVVEQKRLGRRMDHSTLEWWSKQNDSAQAIIKPSEEDVSILEFSTILDKFISKYNITKDSYWFSRGMMDYNIMEDIYFSTLNEDLPKEYAYWNTRDLRTAIHFMVGDERGKIPLDDDIMNQATEHNALHDCCLDALRLQKCFDMLGD